MVHTARPRFGARWTTGDDLEEIAALPRLCWSDQGSGSSEDAIHGYGVERSSDAPDQAAFERLTDEVAREMGAWIARRL